MDFVSAWKAVSIALAGAFGLMALLTENKDKESGKLTTWGKVSLVGIVLSTTLGVAAQLKETSDEAQRQEASAIQTLKLLNQTSHAVSDIQRLLSPLEISAVFLSFEGECDDQEFVDFCAKAKKFRDSGNWKGRPSISTVADPAVWKMWHEQDVIFPVSFYFFREGPDPQRIRDADLVVNVRGSNENKDKSLVLAWTDDNKIRFELDAVPYSQWATGKITSLMDLEDASFFMTELYNKLARLTPTQMAFQTKQGRMLTIDTAKLERISLDGGQVGYRYKFGNSTRPADADNTSSQR
jgi:hypothetical protein